MGRTNQINPEEFDAKVKLLRDFFSPSKVYPYSNYLSIKAEGDSVEFSLPLIIGEAISTGCMTIKVNVEVLEPFDVIVPCKEFLEACKVSLGTEITLTRTKGYLSINNGRRDLKVPLATAGEGIPTKIRHDFEVLKQEPKEPFNIKDLNDILGRIGKEIKAQTIDYAYHGIYITNTQSYVTNGMSITKYDKGLDGGHYYIPFFSLKLFKAFDSDTMEVARKELYQDKSPFLCFKDGDVEFYIQEWMAKNTYPAGPIHDLFLNDNLIELDVEEVSSALMDVTSMGRFAHLDFKEGIMYDEQRRITATIPTLDEPPISFTSELLPRKAEYKKMESIHLVTDGLESIMIKFDLGDVQKLVAKVVPQ